MVAKGRAGTGERESGPERRVGTREGMGAESTRDGEDNVSARSDRNRSALCVPSEREQVAMKGAKGGGRGRGRGRGGSGVGWGGGRMRGGRMRGFVNCAESADLAIG
jgi:hypothetical protein